MPPRTASPFELVDKPILHLPDRIAIGRARLLRVLERAMSGRVTLLSAPAGFGKTTLLHQFVAGCGLPAVYVGGDAGLSRRLVQTTEMRADEPFVLILDESEPRRVPLTAAIVLRAAATLPPNARLIAARRAPWPTDLVGTLHAMCVDEHDLAFTDHEFVSLVDHVVDGKVGNDVIDALVHRVQGWPAGALLASISLRAALDVTLFVEEFGGDDRHVSRYLDEEVLQGLDEEDRLFLEVTSLQSTLQGPFCDAVTGQEDGIDRLEDLYGRGVLSRTSTTNGHEYHCHALLRDLLWRRFTAAHHLDAQRVAERAAAWYLERGLPQKSLGIYAKSAMWGPMTELIHEHGRSMFDDGLDQHLVTALQRAPAPFWEHERLALLELAYLQTWMGETRAAETAVDQLARVRPTPGEQVVLNVLRASWVRRHAHAGSAMRAADTALDLLGGPDPVDPPNVFGVTPASDLETFALCYRGVSRWHLGEVDEARVDLRSALARGSGYALWQLRGRGDLALLEAWSGSLREAERLAHDALGIAEDNEVGDHQCLIEAHLALAHVARERNELDLVEEHIDQAREFARKHRESTALVLCTIEEALLRLAEGHPHAGLRAIERDRRIVEAAPATRFVALLDIAEAAARLAIGDRGCALALVPRDDASDAYARVVAIRVALGARDRDTATALVASWPDSTGLHDRLARAWWTALVEHLAGDRRRAALRALDLVGDIEREGHARVVLDSMPYGLHLLRDTNRLADSDVLASILDAAEGAAHSVDAGVPDLSDREVGIIRYLPTRLSTIEIASQLFISRNTLKTHLRSIYRKLEVSGRDEAVRRAEELGLA